MKMILLPSLLMPLLLFAQPSKHDSIWMPMKFFVGKWKGEGDGEPGKGVYERSYQFVLNRNFIEVKNQSTYPPTDKNPKGETHQDNGYISYDKGRKLFILRQFHVEGFVNQYRLESISADGRTMVFISEAIENISPGWKAKETYQLVNDDQFIETFELAPPNGKFEVYTRTILHRVKS